MGETLKLRMCEICQQTDHVETIVELSRKTKD